MKLIVGAVLCSAAIIGQIGTASAQYYYGSPAGIYQGSTPAQMGPPGPYYYYAFTSPAGIYSPPPAQPQQYPGGIYSPPPALVDGPLGCAQTKNGWCQRVR